MEKKDPSNYWKHGLFARPYLVKTLGRITGKAG
jgi:hypothetical protein